MKYISPIKQYIIVFFNLFDILQLYVVIVLHCIRNLSFSAGLTFNNFEIAQTEGLGYWSCTLFFYGATEIIVGAKRIVKLNTIEIPLEAKYRC